MPNFDGTGPNGLGPMSGKGRGQCNPSQRQKRGFGARGSYCPFAESQRESLTVQEKIEALKSHKKNIEAEIEALEKEIK